MGTDKNAKPSRPLTNQKHFWWVHWYKWYKCAVPLKTSPVVQVIPHQHPAPPPWLRQSRCWVWSCNPGRDPVVSCFGRGGIEGNRYNTTGRAEDPHLERDGLRKCWSLGQTPETVWPNVCHNQGQQKKKTLTQKWLKKTWVFVPPLDFPTLYIYITLVTSFKVVAFLENTEQFLKAKLVYLLLLLFTWIGFFDDADK